MAIDDLRFINAALTRVGFETLTTLPGNTAQGKVAAQNYEQFVIGVLSGYPWKFATTTRQLNHLSAAPDPPWTHAYTRPNDMLALRTILVEGVGVDYEVMTTTILCDQDEDQTVIATFVWRVPEAYWPGWFGEAITQRLEEIFLRSASKFDEAADRGKSADRQLEIAKFEDSKTRTPRNPRRYPILEARRA